MRLILSKTLFFAFMSFFMLGYGKINSQTLFTIDNYRIPTGVRAAVVGKVHNCSIKRSPDDKIVYRIIKDTAGIFKIDSEGIISLKRNKTALPDGPFRYAVTISAASRGKKKRVEIKEFELVKDQFLKNMVVAHRGAWKESAAPQNSIKALKNAIDIGCSWSEFDLWMSADGIPVCNHDPSIKGHKVEETSASILTSVELSPGEYLPTVEQYIRTAMEQNKTGLVVEIKPSGISLERTLELTEKVVNLVHNLKAQAWVSYISFSYESLERVLELDPMAKTAYLGSNKSVDEVSTSRMWGIDFNISLFKRDPLLTAKAKEKGLTVNVWTVNSQEDLKLMIDMGVDFITTNEPELLFRMINQNKDK